MIVCCVAVGCKFGEFEWAVLLCEAPLGVTGDEGDVRRAMEWC